MPKDELPRLLVPGAGDLHGRRQDFLNQLLVNRFRAITANASPRMNRFHRVHEKKPRRFLAVAAKKCFPIIGLPFSKDYRWCITGT
jgi:hypothetical protein